MERDTGKKKKEKNMILNVISFVRSNYFLIFLSRLYNPEYVLFLIRWIFLTVSLKKGVVVLFI